MAVILEALARALTTTSARAIREARGGDKNGAEVATSTGAAAYGGTDADLVLGFPGDQYFKGLIDEVYVYDRALTETEIKTVCGCSVSTYSISGNAGTPATGTGYLAPNTEDLRIGRDPCCSGRHFNGLIDEFRIYNTALTGSEVSVLKACTP